ncbi:MAG: phage scaffolding protein, partial [Selenomonadales bacterium]|nr:phage scaffolding protein [Selenomonadales bacterium]
RSFLRPWKRWCGTLTHEDDMAEIGMVEEPSFAVVPTSPDNRGDDQGTDSHRIGYIAWYNKGLLDAGKVPVVLAFHGGGDSALHMAHVSGWYRVAKRNNFLLITVENHLNSTATEAVALLEELKKKSGDADALKAEIEKLQSENKTAADKFAADLKALKINNAVERALSSAGAKNLKAVKALLDLNEAEMDGEDVKGLADQIKRLKTNEDTKFLFGETAPGFTGVKGGDNGKKSAAAITKEAFAKMGYKERAELYNKDQAAYEALSAQTTE